MHRPLALLCLTWIVAGSEPASAADAPATTGVRAAADAPATTDVLAATAGGPATTEVPADVLARAARWSAATDFERISTGVTVTTRSEDYDGHGKVLHAEQVVSRLGRSEEGLLRTEILSATRDGKDNLAQARRKQEKAEADRAKKRDRNRPDRMTTPFDAQEQARYTFRLLPALADAPGMLHVAYAPKGEPAPELYVGEAKLDPRTGAVRWLRQTLSKMPTLVDRVEMEMEFNTPSPHGPLLSVLKFDGSGGLPLFKKHGRATLTFSDYALNAPAAAAEGTP